MVRWKSARLRRLYGKPDDLLEDDAPKDSKSSPAPAEALSTSNAPTPAPVVKRVKREKTRPESEYELICNMPVTASDPDYSTLVNPLSESQSKVVAYAIHSSRQNWLQGSILETFWTRKPRTKKGESSSTQSNTNQMNLRDKMTKLHECLVTIGPHTFPVKLFAVKDDNVHIDEEQDAVVEQKLQKLKPQTENKDKEPKPETPKPETSKSENSNLENQNLGTKTGSNEPANESSSTNTKNVSNQIQQPVIESPKSQTATAIVQPSQDSESKKTTENPISPEIGADAAKPSTKQSENGPSEPPKKRRKTKKNDNDNKSFATEREGLELEKRRNEELEQKLKNSSVASDTVVKTPASNPAPPQPAEIVAKIPPKIQNPAGISNSPNTRQTPANHGAQGPQTLSQPQSQPQPQQPQQPQQNTTNSVNSSPNQLVVYKLQQMAARDSTLSELMKNVASGTASPESIANFQEIIARVKSSIVIQMREPKNAYRPEVAKPPTYQQRTNLRAIMLAIEFDESPTDRFLLPKRSILEHVNSDDVYMSFLHVADGKYSPVTFKFHNIPLRIFQTMERCVRKPEVVSFYMEEAMKLNKRAESMKIWFQIEKNDEILVDMIKKSSPPSIVQHVALKKPTKPRKPRQPTPQYLQFQQMQMQQQQMRARSLQQSGTPVASMPNMQYSAPISLPKAKLVNGSPLRTLPMFKTAGLNVSPAQPFIQSPSFLYRNPNISSSLALPDPRSIQIGPHGFPPLPMSMRSSINYSSSPPNMPSVGSNIGFTQPKPKDTPATEKKLTESCST
ncbi:hypothetical protein DASB73_042940 [Starmerella bacillaris]|uniref:SWR1-complex protein 3 domain-containing protein n=1 Tax=Starmerella bacillaris TaxID=1247836 RepID=A0AAV5RQC8_STABA|nr:hypothetical protein DASB73_042940 [Starmerella bacillaris]